MNANKTPRRGPDVDPASGFMYPPVIRELAGRISYTEAGENMEQYVERREGGYYIVGSRISLDGVVHLFKEGSSPESILRRYPLIGSLEKVYGAITFYLANKDAVEAFLRDQEHLSQELGASQSPLPESLSKKLSRDRDRSLQR